jgi:hypothetical protein
VWLAEFTAAITTKAGDPAQFVDDGKGFPSDWGEPGEFDKDFNEEFNSVDNSSIPPNDVDDVFTPDVLDDTYLNMELALPRSGGEVEFAR